VPSPRRSALARPTIRSEKHYSPQSSSASRFTASHAGFLLLSQSGERLERYVNILRFDTMSSRPILHAWANTVGPSVSMCSLRRKPGAARFNSDASVALRTSSGSRRRSSPAADLKLPKFEADGNRYQYSWPPPQPNLALQIAAIRPDPFLVHEAAKGTYIEERNRRILEDNRRQIAEAEQRQREFEERQRKELESAKERDRQAYRERGW
jgi:hypothetical protein